MNNELSDIFFDCSLNNFHDVPEKFKEYCENAVLMIKDPNTFYLFNEEEYAKFIEKIKKVKHSTEILRYFECESVEIASIEYLPAALQNYAKHFWNQKLTTFYLTLKDDFYLIYKK